MTRRLIILFALALLGAASAFAQDNTGGIKGTVINREGRLPVEKAQLVLMKGAAEVATALSDEEGNFLIPDLEDGNYTLVIKAPEYLEQQVNLTVNDGYVKNMFNLSLTKASTVADAQDESTVEFDMEDTGYSDNPTVLFGSNDIFDNIASFKFSAVRFRARGYSSESQEVSFAGVKMNDAVTGYAPFSLWSGLNEATRSKDSSSGLEASEYGFGGYNGVNNVFGDASSMRKGFRASIMTNSALYRLRLMASYATGRMDNGWAFAANVSARLGGNDWIDGVYYRSFAYYLAADKYFGDAHKLSAIFFGTPGQRGAQMASTQEVYDLMGDNMYNANWGYQNGKVRNSRVRKTHEPVAVLKYEYTPSSDFKLALTALYRFGKNGYTALDWYNAQDPRPDYYRNLPSYFYNPDPNMRRNNPDKAAAAEAAWYYGDPEVVHLNWDRLYSVNRQSADGRSKYVQEERHTDQHDFNFAATVHARPLDWLTVNGGFNMKINRTEYYKIVADLLGGEYFLDVDNFADRDYAATPYKTQNDLAYYLQNGTTRKLGKGDKYGYDYYAHIRDFGVWGTAKGVLGNFSATLGIKLGYKQFWREGLVRKGLFPGEVTAAEIAGIYPNLSLDERKVLAKSMSSRETSYGNSAKIGMPVFGAKLNLNYVIGGSMRVYANVGYFRDAPTFNQCFVSPRTRNTIVGAQPIKTFASDINWQWSGKGINIRATAYYTTIRNQSKVMSAYDDLQNAFSNFALRGIDERHVGFELGFKIPAYFVENLYIQGALAFGRNVYTSTPTFIQTVDNSAEKVSYLYKDGDKLVNKTEIPVTFWSETPILKKDVYGNYTQEILRYQKHYVPSIPQLAASLGLSYSIKYWFFELDVQAFAEAYLDMNPLYRTQYAVAGPDYSITPEEIMDMTTQEKFDPAFLLNASVGKSWYIKRKYNIGFSANIKNMLNDKGIKTGGYEQTRMVDNTENKDRYYRFDSKYYYSTGINYMLNVYFRF
ncbi:MAG: carboxypeptidase regulatory-like domain-containing protein [Bacteroidales bacterium]|nr:carboxypeptidase regulatory-like domain-containing protein [Bacteroidales bacterium]